MQSGQTNKQANKRQDPPDSQTNKRTYLQLHLPLWQGVAGNGMECHRGEAHGRCPGCLQEERNLLGKLEGN